VADLSVLQVRAEVDELSMGLVKPGQRACTRSDAFPGVEFCGEVKDVAKALGRRHFGGGSPGGHTEDVKIVEITCSLPAGDSRLVSGQSVETIIQVATKEDVLAVPEAALKERNGEVFARLQTGSKVEERLIEAGASDGMFREVKAGLAAGDRVVIER
jgi:multidrug resistance efflux pump